MTPEQGIYILSLSEAGAPPHFSLLFFLLKAEKLPNVTTSERASERENPAVTNTTCREPET